MTKELLENKKAQLEIEKQQQFINDADNNEIAQKVSEYEDQLIADKKAEYAETIKAIENKLELLNELIQDATEEEIEQPILEDNNEA